MSGTALAACVDSLQRMTLLAEEERLNRDLLVRSHEQSRGHLISMMQLLMSSHPFGGMTSLRPAASAPLSSLKVITLPQLILGKQHQGRVLHGRLCVRPFKMGAVFTVLEDENGRGARLMIYNVLPMIYNVLPGSASWSTSPKAVEDRFPPGMRVIVKEPLFKVWVDGKTVIEVDNPEDIALDESEQMDSSPSPNDTCNDAKLTEELEAIRCEGNELFGRRDWIGATNKYSQCIDKAVSKIGTKITNKSASSEFNKVVMLAYSNRAEAKLRVGAFEDALRDADKALAYDCKHVKTLVRKGKVAHALGLFEKACTSFEAALDQSPQKGSILNYLKASTIANEQSRTRNYSLCYICQSPI